MNTHERAGRLCASPEWRTICETQRVKGLLKYGRSVDAYDGEPGYWASHGAQEGADGAVYALRAADSGHPIRGRLSALLFALAARLLLPLTR